MKAIRIYKFKSKNEPLSWEIGNIPYESVGEDYYSISDNLVYDEIDDQLNDEESNTVKL